MGTDEVLRLAVFGPSRFVRAGEQDGPEPTLTQRRILERLALSAPACVSIGDLVDAVWGDDPPRHARAAIQNQVSRIRALWGESVIRTDADGYVLGVETDAGAQSRVADRAERLLDRGDHGAAFAHADAVLPLWTGRPFSSIGHVPGVDAARRGLSAIKESAENTRLRAGILLNRIGWAIAEAERLVAESPYDELRRSLLAHALASAGRRGDALASLASARRAIRDGLGIEPGPLLEAAEFDVRGEVGMSAELPYTGRRRELRLTLTALAAEGVAHVIAEPGGGLSRFLDDVSANLGELGVRVVRVSALDHLDAADGVLRRVLQEAGVGEPSTSGVVAAFSETFAQVASTRPHTVVVDDAQALGATARSVLREASTRVGISVLIGEHPEDGALPANALVLAPLTLDEVASLLRIRGEDPALAAAQHAYTGGNPLALTLLHDRGASGSGATDRSGLDELADALLSRLDRTERALVERIAVFGDDAPGPTLDDIPDVLVLSGSRVRFRHGVLREKVYRTIAPAHREELHWEAALAADAAGASPASVARHALAAGSLSGTLAIDACRAAAADASRLGAHADAARWLERCLDAASPEPIALRIAWGDALRLAGDPRHLKILMEATREAIGTGEQGLIASACRAMLQLGSAAPSGSIVQVVQDLLATALPMLTDPVFRAPVLAAASLSVSLGGDASRCRSFFDEAEDLARDSRTRADVLPFAYMALGMPGDLDRREALAAELLRLGEALDDPVASFEGWQLDASARIQRADGAGLRRAEKEMAALVERVGDVGRRWGYLFTRAAVAHLDGDLATSTSASAQARALFEPISPSRAAAVAMGQELALRMAQGSVADLAPLLGALVAQQPGVPAWHAALAHALAEAGERVGALRHARLALENAQEDVTWLAAHVVGARAVARAGDVALANAYLERLEPWHDRATWQGSCCYGPVATATSLLHRSLGDMPRANRAASAARQVAEGLGGVPFLAELETLATG